MQYNYDLQKRVTKITKSVGYISFAYDAVNRVIKETAFTNLNKHTQTTTYEYIDEENKIMVHRENIHSH